jgi:hypothetical protein
MHCDLIHTVQCAQCQRNIVMVFRNPLVELYCFADLLHRRKGVAFMEREQAQIMESVRVIRKQSQNMPVVAFGLEECSGLMVRNGRGKQIGERLTVCKVFRVND